MKIKRLAFYDFYSLFNNYFITSTERLSNNIINIYRNYNIFYVVSADALCLHGRALKAVFSSGRKKICDTIALSVVYDNYCPTKD